MNYPKSEAYNTPALQEKIMGPNPVKLGKNCSAIIGFRTGRWSAIWEADRD